MGYRGKCLNGLTHEWLKDRIQSSGKWGEIKSGPRHQCWNTGISPGFIIIIIFTDIDFVRTSDITKYVYDTKRGRLIRLDNHAVVLEETLKGLHKWVSIWVKTFKIEKCMALTVGKKNRSLKLHAKNSSCSVKLRKGPGCACGLGSRSANHQKIVKNRVNTLRFISRSINSVGKVRCTLDYAVKF